MSELKDILEFQVEKRLFSLGKVSLEEIEKFRNYSIVLEKILKNAGFEDNEYLKSDELFKSSRKKILDETNENNRELQELMKKFDIKLKR